MKKRIPGLLSGIFLIIFGILIILDNLYYLYFTEDYAFSYIFTAAGIVFLVTYLLDKKKIWAVVLSLFFLFVGISIFISESRYMPEGVIGGLFTFIVGTGFLSAYLKDKKNWWAIIPAGILYTVTIMVVLGEYYWYYEDFLAPVFFTGTGLTFGILYLIRNEENKLYWAKIPALILLIFGIFSGAVVFVDFDENLGFSFILIAAGIAIILYHFLRSKKESSGEIDTYKNQEIADNNIK